MRGKCQGVYGWAADKCSGLKEQQRIWQAVHHSGEPLLFLWAGELGMKIINSDAERLALLTKFSSLDGYEQMDDIYDALLMLMTVGIMDIPVFYHSNMVIMRRSFLEKLLAGSHENHAVRAGVYIFLAMLVLHAPVVRSEEQKKACAVMTGIMPEDLQDDAKGIKREVLVRLFNLERNVFLLGMKLLQDKLQLVSRFPDGSYGFAMQPVAEAEDLNIRSAGVHLAAFSAVLKAMWQAEILTGIMLEGDDAAQAEFDNEEEGKFIVSSVLANCGIRRWQEEIKEAIRAQDGNPAHEKVARKLLELAGDTPFVSASGTNFCLLRQEMLAYIVMLGYDGTPLLSQLANGQQLTLSKVAMVVLIFLFIRADEEGYICKEAKGKSGYAELLQLKDIAFACHISMPMVSKALKHWLLAGVIKRVTCAGIRGYRFSNQMPMLHI